MKIYDLWLSWYYRYKPTIIELKQLKKIASGAFLI